MYGVVVVVVLGASSMIVLMVVVLVEYTSRVVTDGGRWMCVVGCHNIIISGTHVLVCF